MNISRIKSVEHIAELDFKLTHNLSQEQISALPEKGKIPLANFPLTNNKLSTGYKNVKFFIDNKLIKSTVSTSFTIEVPSDKIKVGESINIMAVIYDKNISLSNDVLVNNIFNDFTDNDYEEKIILNEIETPSIYQYSIDITNNLTQVDINKYISIFNNENIVGEKIVLKNIQLNKFGDIFNTNMNNFRFILDNKPIKHYFTKKQGIDLMILEIPYSKLKPSKMEVRLFVYDKNTIITMDTSIFAHFHDPISAVPTGVSGGTRVTRNGENVMQITSTNVQNWTTGTDKYKDILSIQERNSKTCIDSFTSGTQSLSAQHEWILVKTNPDNNVATPTREHSKYTEILNKFTIRRFLISNDTDYKAYYYPDFKDNITYGYLEGITYGNITNNSKTGTVAADTTWTALQIVMRNPLQTTLNAKFNDINYKLITIPVKRLKATIKNTLGYNALSKYIDQAYEEGATGEKIILENFDISEYEEYLNTNYNNIDFNILNGKKIKHYLINKQNIKKFVLEIPYNEINVGNTKIQINIYDQAIEIPTNPEIFKYIHDTPVVSNLIQVGDHNYSDIITVEKLTGDNENYFKSIINNSQQNPNYRDDDPITKIGKLNTANGIWKYTGENDIFDTLQESTLTYNQKFNNFHMTRLLQKDRIVYFADYLNNKTNKGYSIEENWKKQPYLYYQGIFDVDFVASMKNIIQSQNNNIQFNDENYHEMIIVENQQKIFFDIIYELEQEDIDEMNDYFIYEGIKGERILLQHFPDEYQEFLRNDKKNIKFFLGDTDLKRDVTGGKFRLFIPIENISPKRLVITCVIFKQDYSFDFDDLSDVQKNLAENITIDINSLNLKPKNLLPNTLCNSESLKVTTDWSLLQNNEYLNKSNYISVKKEEENVFEITNPDEEIEISLFNEEANKNTQSFTMTHYLPVESDIEYTFSLDIKSDYYSLSINEFDNLKSKINETIINEQGNEQFQRSSINFNTDDKTKWISFKLVTKGKKVFIKNITFNEGTNSEYCRSNIHDNDIKYATMFYQQNIPDRQWWSNIINLTKGSNRVADVRLNQDEKSQDIVLGGYNLKIPEDARITNSIIITKVLANKEDSIKTTSYELYNYDTDEKLTNIDNDFNSYKQNYLTKTSYETVNFKNNQLFKNETIGLSFGAYNANDEEVKVSIGLLGMRIWYDQKGEDYISNLLNFENFSKYRLQIQQNIETSDRNIYFTDENGNFINTLREITNEEITGKKLYLNVDNLTENENFNLKFYESEFINDPFQNISNIEFTDGNYSKTELPPTIFITPRIPENRYIEREDPDEGIPEVEEQNIELDVNKFTQEAMATEMTFANIKFLISNGASISSAKVDFGSNLTKYTDSMGECTFNNVKIGIYDFRVSRTGFFTETVRDVVIDKKNNEIFVTLDPIGNSLDFNIESGTNKLSNARIKLGNLIGYTDNDGYYSFKNVPMGIHKIQITKEGYLTRFLDYNLSKSVKLDIELNEGNTYTLTFNIKDKNTNIPVEGVKIDFDNYIGYTDSNGKCIIQYVNQLDEYEINMTKEDYVSIQDTIRVSSNKTYDYQMEKEIVRDPNLIGSYDFENAKSKGSTNTLIKDSGLYGNDATMVGFNDVSWLSDGSLKFNGSNTLITTPISQSILANDFALETIINFGTKSNMRGIAGDHDQGGSNGLAFGQFYNTYHDFYINNYNSIKSDPLIGYRHVIMTKVSDNIKVYIDGVLIGTGNKIGTPNLLSNMYILIGRSYNASNRYIDSSMKIFNIYNKALTQQEITDKYNKFVNEGRV